MVQALALNLVNKTGQVHLRTATLATRGPIAALRAADAGDIVPLLSFVRS
jgi:hypothetical protein